jgi:hypothetical protein
LRHGSGRPSAVCAGWDLAGPRAGLNDDSGRSIGRVLVTPRGAADDDDSSIGRVLGAFPSSTSSPVTGDGSPAAGATIAGSSGTGLSGTGMAGTGSSGPGSARLGSARPGDPGPAGSGGGGPGPARSASSPWMKSVKEPLL